ncbi:hypothetical protein OH773_12055 [Buttiauxella sp. WJP83]|uniref:hypothetical protein n=1 Tax=Buttiauxella sp. WJP83 TaxID=2986951 RepID=UPI0022DD11AD|nr:hypothetical protein [Buttiauxella sp. WJP83]WBM68935.1 hypothetical protein OH773_12055 [Buttiauxella sp. WJP83]
MFRSVILVMVLLISSPLVARAGDITLMPDMQMDIGVQIIQSNHLLDDDLRIRGRLRHDHGLDGFSDFDDFGTPGRPGSFGLLPGHDIFHDHSHFGHIRQ